MKRGRRGGQAGWDTEAGHDDIREWSEGERKLNQRKSESFIFAFLVFYFMSRGILEDNKATFICLPKHLMRRPSMPRNATITNNQSISLIMPCIRYD